MEKITFGHIDLHDDNKRYRMLCKMLPNQGHIEFQQDEPFKEHSWHSHENTETLLILKGKLNFYYEGGNQDCFPGDYIHLPKNIKHGSKTFEEGCIYAISFRKIEIFDDLLNS